MSFGYSQRRGGGGTKERRVGWEAMRSSSRRPDNEKHHSHLTATQPPIFPTNEFLLPLLRALLVSANTRGKLEITTSHSEAMADRFARLKSDPRFRRPRRKDAKVVVDDRFKSVFQDSSKKGKKGRTGA